MGPEFKAEFKRISDTIKILCFQGFSGIWAKEKPRLFRTGRFLFCFQRFLGVYQLKLEFVVSGPAVHAVQEVMRFAVQVQMGADRGFGPFHLFAVVLGHAVVERPKG